ncbi:unnamed protein product [Miscanthus lutarioriparius]|uniref:Uncharacterized protein n=1 Tax=Miscanthus lutarioriparius TaxID=422564 RepID=A0A811NBN1_9POAL|nr:unnamed protein product [Miscanthus lutarioriparius]
MDQSRRMMESYSSSRMVDGVTANYKGRRRWCVAVFSGGHQMEDHLLQFDLEKVLRKKIRAGKIGCMWLLRNFLVFRLISWHYQNSSRSSGPPPSPVLSFLVSFTRITDPKLADRFSNSLPPNPSTVTKAQCNCYDLGGSSWSAWRDYHCTIRDKATCHKSPKHEQPPPMKVQSTVVLRTTKYPNKVEMING